MCLLDGVCNSRVIVACPDFVVSWVLVAFTVTLPAEAGAEKSPLEFMLPTLAVHVTEEL